MDIELPAERLEEQVKYSLFFFINIQQKIRFSLRMISQDEIQQAFAIELNLSKKKIQGFLTKGYLPLKVKHS